MSFKITVVDGEGINHGTLVVAEGTPIPDTGNYIYFVSGGPIFQVRNVAYTVQVTTVVVVLLVIQYAATTAVLGL